MGGRLVPAAPRRDLGDVTVSDASQPGSATPQRNPRTGAGGGRARWGGAELTGVVSLLPEEKVLEA